MSFSQSQIHCPGTGIGDKLSETESLLLTMYATCNAFFLPVSIAFLKMPFPLISTLAHLQGQEEALQVRFFVSASCARETI